MHISIDNSLQAEVLRRNVAIRLTVEADFSMKSSEAMTLGQSWVAPKAIQSADAGEYMRE